MRLLLALLVLAVARPWARAADEHWCYEIQKKTEPNCLGPKEWKWDCQKKRQSPINIIASNAEVKKDLGLFSFSSYEKKKKWNVTNNGHTVLIDLNKEAKIEGGGLNTEYQATQLHFHWSRNLTGGSEHSINGEHTAMEMHIVHQKKQLTSKSQRASENTSEDIAVLAFLVKVGSQNDNFQPLVDILPTISKPNTSTAMNEPVSLFDLIPEKEKLKDYFRYLGSLTTPECSETVVWTVFQEPIYLGKDQVLPFSEKLFYDKSRKKNMTDNVRPPMQSLEGRSVYKSYSSAAPERLLPLALTTLLVPALAYLTAGSL
ncbi:LOW QUALITY PROTEIN: carbonic anhydrase 4 [Suncus etruscus]|uniref:LOW QUALITY PROTEIN: carbonic anhydrase 4 n=1 Tax=Suncus etruscus TaxID=109475 RepID=UPI00210FA005|nr:LOW QUALITY PROTEIN: carbonic anhydrase 4 [Suncus etruscus]